MRVEGFTPLSIEIAETEWSTISPAISHAWLEICAAARHYLELLKEKRVVDRLCVYVCPDSGKVDIGWNGPRPFNGHIAQIKIPQLEYEWYELPRPEDGDTLVDTEAFERGTEILFNKAIATIASSLRGGLANAEMQSLVSDHNIRVTIIEWDDMETGRDLLPAP
jgi:hypothetical protein